MRSSIPLRIDKNNNNSVITYLFQVETQTDQLESMREKLRQKEDDSRAMQSKYELLDRKLGDSEHQNRELFSVISKKEESMNHSQVNFPTLPLPCVDCQLHSATLHLALCKFFFCCENDIVNCVVKSCLQISQRDCRILAILPLAAF